MARRRKRRHTRKNPARRRRHARRNPAFLGFPLLLWGLAGAAGYALYRSKQKAAVAAANAVTGPLTTSDYVLMA